MVALMRSGAHLKLHLEGPSLPERTRKGDVLTELHNSQCVTGYHRIPSRQARLVKMPSVLDQTITEVLKQRGVTELYSHQLECLEHVQAGRNTVVLTPTASGKTLC